MSPNWLNKITISFLFTHNTHHKLYISYYPYLIILTLLPKCIFKKGGRKDILPLTIHDLASEHLVVYLVPWINTSTQGASEIILSVDCITVLTCLLFAMRLRKPSYKKGRSTWYAACDLFGPLKWDRSDSLPVLSLVFKRSCNISLSSKRCLPSP